MLVVVAATQKSLLDIPRSLKRKLRSILSGSLTRRAISWCVAFYIDLVFHTTRWQRVDEAMHAVEDMVLDGPIIFCVWHGRQFMMPKFWPSGRPLWAVGSTSRDGQLALSVAERFGIHLILRSRFAASPNTARTILRVLGSGHCTGITPDGSQGPERAVKKGVVELAKLSGFPLVPATYSCSNAISLKSWDRFVIPFPFGRGVFRVGIPIHVERSATPADVEKARSALESQLNAMTDSADAAVGCRPKTPAETSKKHVKQISLKATGTIDADLQ